LWLAQRDRVVLLLLAVAIVVTATVGFARLSRARTAKRFGAIWDAYAEREIDGERRSNQPLRSRDIPAHWADQPAKA
jgi:hypothetical protein